MGAPDRPAPVLRFRSPAGDRSLRTASGRLLEETPREFSPRASLSRVVCRGLAPPPTRDVNLPLARHLCCLRSAVRCFERGHIRIPLTIVQCCNCSLALLAIVNLLQCLITVRGFKASTGGPGTCPPRIRGRGHCDHLAAHKRQAGVVSTIQSKKRF